MASIGGVACSFVHGEVAPQLEETITWDTVGINGLGAMTVGTRARPSELQAVLYSASVNAWIALVQALQGSLVTVITSRGVTAASCLVVHVGTPRVTAALHAGGYRAEIPVYVVKT